MLHYLNTDGDPALAMHVQELRGMRLKRKFAELSEAITARCVLTCYTSRDQSDRGMLASLTLVAC